MILALREHDRPPAFREGQLDIAGDELTGPEMASILSDVTGRTVRFQQIPIEQIRSYSEDVALMLEWFDAVGYNADIAQTSAEFGVPPTRFREWAKAQSWS